MAMSLRLVPGVALFCGLVCGCNAPDRGDEPTAETQTETKRSALTTSLFEPYVKYPTGSNPAAVAIGDLDGDGRNDIGLLTSMSGDTANDFKVYVFLQNVDGSLKPAVKYPVGVNGNSIDIGDVNEDGRADVVVGLRGVSNKIGVLLQNASGTLGTMVPYATTNSYQVKVGDFNGDGRKDIAGISFNANANAGGLDVFLQTETGTLAAPVTYNVPHEGFGELDAGDIDGDGRTDLAVTNGQGFASTVNILLQTSDGTFGTPSQYSVGSGISARGVALGDVNGDGRSDIVVSYGGNRPNTFVARFLQNAAGGIDPAVSYPSADFPTAVVLADMDADGRKDAVVVHDNALKLGVYRQFPSGDFVSEEQYPIANGHQSAPQALAVGDINGDGRPDAVIADSSNGLVVLRHVQDTSLALAITAPTPAGGPYYVGAPLTVRWTAGDNVALAGFDVSVSFDGGASYTPIASCTGLPGTARECTWTPGQPGIDSPLRVTVRDAAGNTASSVTTFSPVAPSVSVSGPNINNFVGVGTTTNISWMHNLPPTGSVRIELSRDGGGTYETLADAAPIGSDASANIYRGGFAWNVTGPTTSTARVRVTANGPLPASGISNFAITTTPTLNVFSPFAGSTVYTTSFGVGWTSNAGNVGTVRIELSRDGGSTFETVVDSIPNTGSFLGVVPGPGAANARMRVTLSVPGVPSVTATSASFTLFHPTLALTSPAAGVTAYSGTTLPIVWSTNFGPTGTSARIDLSRDGGSTYQFLAIVSNTSSFNWQVTGPSSNAAQVRVTLMGAVSMVVTSGPFAIVVPSVTVTSPAAGDTLYTGTPLTITWSSNLPATSMVTVSLSRNGGSTYLPLGDTTNTGSFAWTVTGPATSTAVFRVQIGGAGFGQGTSGALAIVVPSLSVTGPAAGAASFAGTPLAITWATNLPAASPVTVELSRDGGSGYEVLATNAPNTGSFAWIAMGPSTGTAVVRVTVGGPGSMSATSGQFAITVPSLTVTGPAAGASFYAGAPLAITWSTNLPAGSTALVELSRDGGGTFETLAAAPNTGSFAWVATGPDSAAVIARVTVTDPVAASGASNAFAIATPSLTVTGPDAGALAYAGTPVTITWTHNLPDVDPVSIELSRDDGATFTVLEPAAPNTGSFVWTASGPDTAAARVRVTSTGAVPAGGVGPAFQIVTPALAVTSPTAGENWVIGTAQTISWSSSNLPGGTTFLVELSRDGGASWATLEPAATGGSLAWTATGPGTSAAIVRVSANGGVPAAATSAAFTIADPGVTVTSPAASASWTIGVAQSITWTSNLSPTATVKIELTRNGGSTYTTLAASAPNTGSFAWTATGSSSTNAFVRVSANGFSASGLSGKFSLVAASVRVTSPNTFVTWTVGTVHAITWTHNLGASAQFKIEVSRSGVWSTITSAVTGGGATSGSYNWTVTGPRTSNAKIRVSWTAGTTVNDTSNVSFSIN